MAKIYADSAKGKPVKEWEELPVHLGEVGRDTAQRASKFGCASLGAVLGNLHEFGKFKAAFQRYSNDPTVKGNGHSTAGGVYAARTFDVLGKAVRATPITADPRMKAEGRPRRCRRKTAN